MKKIKKEIENLFQKSIIVFKDHMDNFEEQETMKKRLIIRKWFDLLIKQNVLLKKPKIVTNKSKDKIINDIWRLFETQKRKEDRMKKILKDKIIRDINTLFEKEKDYYKHKKVSNFWNNNYI